MRNPSITLALFLTLSCGGDPGPAGPQGAAGPSGAQGPAGKDGQPGQNGTTPDGGIINGTGPYTASGSRIKQQVMVGTDGLRLPWGLWDSQRQEVCTLLLADDGQHRCLPVIGNGPVASDGYFSDGACSQSLFWAGAGYCPKYGYTSSPMGTGPGCAPPNSFHMYMLSNLPTQPTMVYSLTGGSCRSVPVPAGTFYKGTVIPASDFVAVQLQTL